MTTLLAMVEGRMRDETSQVHLTSDRVAAFLDASLSGVDRERAVRHLAECAECRSEVTELRVVLDTSRATRKRTWLGGAAALAAALAFAILPGLVRDDLTPPGEGGSTTIGAVRASDAAPLIGIHAPSNGAIVPRSGVTLTWQPVGTGVEYSVVVQDTAGASIWSTRLTDT